MQVEIPNGWGIKSFEQAKEIAADLTDKSGELHIACDREQWTSPRYIVIKAPKVGDEISYAFNGDYYPCGKIKSISKSLRLVIADNGKKFYRRAETACWKMAGGTWSMVAGHIDRRNPEF